MQLKKFIILSLIGCLLASCSLIGLTSKQSNALIPKITLTPSMTALVGQVNSTAGGGKKPLSDTVVRLAEVYWNAAKTDGAYVVDGARSPSAITNKDGQFSFVNIKPGDYAIVVGDLIGYNVVIKQDNGKAKIYTCVSGQILDVGELDVNLTQ